MAVSKAQIKATAKYVKENYDRIEIKPIKGTKERYLKEAQSRGQSMTEFITMCVEKEIKERLKDGD